jgi:hypothetical protein
VTVVDRQTGAESERSVEAISAADAEAIVGEDERVFAGRARRADGTPEASGSPFDRVSYLGYDPAEGIENEVRMELGSQAQPPVATGHGPVPRRAANADIRELIEATKLVSDRLAWIQLFLVWTFYGIGLILLCWTVSMIFISIGVADDFILSPWYLMPAIPITICIVILTWLLRTVYPSFGVRPYCGTGRSVPVVKQKRRRR